MRRGSLYLSVLGASFIVAVLALAGMRAARVHLRATTSEADLVQARLLAQSAIELGMAQLCNNVSWRTVYSVDTDYPAPPVVTGGGKYVWRLKSAGGLNRTLQGTGTVGDASCTLQVDLAQPPALDGALLAGGDLTVDSDCTLTAEDAPVVSNGELRVDGVLTADYEAQTLTNNGTIVGTQTTPGAVRVLPTPSMVFDYYESNGTVLAPGVSGGNVIIQGFPLSPSSSWAGTNADGIYVIDTQGYDLSISASRIVGTIVVTDLAPGKKVIISGLVNWEPAYPHYPALLVDGDVEIQIQDGDLTESFLTLSYNPVGTPYRGEEDSDKSDKFISSIAGIIYCSGDLTIVGDGSNDRFPDLRGLVIAGGEVRVESQIMPTVKYDDTFATSPPPGFDQTDDVVIVPGSWRQVTP